MAVLDYHADFAAVYDSFYMGRDVERETAQLVELLDLERPGPSISTGGGVLDIGCGCGSHVLSLARRGHRATGIDLSSAMIERARGKAAEEGLSVDLIRGNPVEELGRQGEEVFDAAFSLFQVINCLPTVGAMRELMTAARQSLRPGSRMVVEAWNGAAVMLNDPRSERNVFDHADEKDLLVERLIDPEVDRLRQTCTLRYRIRVIDKTIDKSVHQFESIHSILFLTPVHYCDVFRSAGFKVLDEFKRHQPGSAVSLKDWYVSYLLEAHDAAHRIPCNPLWTDGF